ncbi:MAG: hypothetical protein ACOH2L_02755 [Devosia sp.]
MNNNMLIRHRDIRNWVTDRNGVPAIASVRNRFGENRAQLKLSFRHASQSGAPSLDEPMTPCSWTAWLAELDRQQLALKVDPDADGFEFVGRGQAS